MNKTISLLEKNASEEKKRRIIKSFHELKKKYQLRECFRDNSECSSGIIEAHSIQRNRILKRIAECGHVLIFEFFYDNGGVKIGPKANGIKETSIFTGFCNNHDSTLFKPIDTNNYEIGNEEQEFLFAYKALAKEHNIKLSMYDAYKEIDNWITNNNVGELRKFHLIRYDNDLDILKDNLGWLKLMLENFKASTRELNHLKKIMNINLDSNRYSNLITKVLTFKEEYPLACSSCISPTNDFEGKNINNFKLLNNDLHNFFLTIFPQNNETYILISFFRKHKNSFTFIDRFLKEDTEKQKILLTNLLLKHVENFAISPSYWEGLNDETKNSAIKMFKNNIAPMEIDLSQVENLNIFV